MNLHMKSGKHVKINRTSFVSQHFFKGLQQVGETEMLSKVNFGRKMLSNCCLLPYFLIFNFEKKFVFYFLYKMQINLKHHVKSEIE